MKPARVTRRRADAERLRPLVEALPAGPGVYSFLGETALPLYIGKSVDVRSRVLQHLRDPGNARLLRQTCRFEVERTVGEIGALLLEAQRVKQRQPLYNQRLRRNRELCSLRLESGRPRIVFARDVDFAADAQLHGLFSGRAAALERLRDLADEHRLCLAQMGLERLPAGRACLRSMLGRCAGACGGAETAGEHAGRLRAALRELALICWPHAGALGLVERDGARVDIHVVRNWCYLGTAATPEAARALGRVAAGFDADGYRILCRPMLDPAREILPL
jgi:excinuclease Cho